jgi:hypothetical protein
MNALFTIPVGIAALDRMVQHPPAFEFSFLQILFLSQVFGLLASTSSTFATQLMLEARSLSRRLLLLSYITAALILLSVFIGIHRTQQPYLSVAWQLSNDCKTYWGVGPSFVLPPIRGIGMIFGIGIAFGLFVVARLRAIELEGSQDRVMMLTFTLLSCIFAPQSVVLSIFLQLGREAVREATESAFQNDSWGYGQIIALFIWASLFIQTLFYIRMLLYET